MPVKRALTLKNVLDKKYDLFNFTDEWKSAFDRPEKIGVWFIWGNSGNGKTSFVLQLIKCLAQFEKVLINSLEEGTSHTFQKGIMRTGMSDIANNRILIVKENVADLTVRLQQRKSPRIVIIDSFQYFQLNYKQYIAFKEQFKDKLLIFISHADGKQPSGRSAKSVMYDSSLKIWVEGYKAFSKGRYIGDTGEFTIWSDGSEKYWLN